LAAIDFEAYNFKKISNSLHIIGSYFGVVFDQQVSDAGKLVHFNRTNLLVSALRFGICAIPLVPLLILQKLSAKMLPGVFKSAPGLYVFPIIQGFFLFGFTKLIALQLGFVRYQVGGLTKEGDDAELVSIMLGQDITAKAQSKSKVDKKKN